MYGETMRICFHSIQGSSTCGKQMTLWNKIGIEESDKQWGCSNLDLVFVFVWVFAPLL